MATTESVSGALGAAVRRQPLGRGAFSQSSPERESAMAHPNVTISAESVCFIIARSRGFDVADIGTDAHSGTNATDKAMTTVPEAHSEDMTQKELRAFINALRETSRPISWR